MQGALEMEAVVAQGCKPIGNEILTITAANKNTVVRINNQRPIQVLRNLFPALPEEDKALVAQSLFLGLQVGSEKMVRILPFLFSFLPYSFLFLFRFHILCSFFPILTCMIPGKKDYLIRSVMFDRESGQVAVGTDEVEEGQKVMFFTRDAASSRDDLIAQLQRKIGQLNLREEGGERGGEGASPEGTTTRRVSRLDDLRGCLMFSCLGRGRGLFGEADHDSKVCRELLKKDVDISGFFCNGEIGPVGQATHLHGFTSSMALFFPPKDPRDSP